MSHSRNFVRTGAWSALLQWSRLGLNAIVFLILWRWLALAEIGAVAAAMAPITFLQILHRLVIPDTVVQEREASDEALSTLYWLSLIIGITVAVTMVAGSFFIGAWIEHPNVGVYLRTLSIGPIFLGAAAIHEGLLRKWLDIKGLTIRATASMTIAGTIAIILGYADFGGWALIAFSLIDIVLSSVFVVCICAWRPKATFDNAYLRRVWPVLLALTGRYCISAALVPLLQLLISGVLGVAPGGAFQIAQRFSSLVDSLTIAPIRFIALPVFSQLQSDPTRLREGTIKAVTLGSLIASPIYLGLAAISPDLLPLTIGTTNAAPSVPVLQALCFYGPPAVVVSIVNEALTARGLSVIVFRRALLMSMIAVFPCVVATYWSVVYVAALYAVLAGFLGLAFTLLLAQRYCSISGFSLLAASARPFAVAILMALAVSLLLRLALSGQPVWMRLVALMLFGALFYATLIWFVAPEQVQIVRGLLANFRSRGIRLAE